MKKSFFYVDIILLLTRLFRCRQRTTPRRRRRLFRILNTNGSVENLYVVNIFDGGAITDYGDYSGYAI